MSGERMVASARTSKGDFDAVEKEFYYSQIRAGIAAGKTDLEVARTAGVCNQTVARYRLRNGLVNPHASRPRKKLK